MHKYLRLLHMAKNFLTRDVPISSVNGSSLMADKFRTKNLLRAAMRSEGIWSLSSSGRIVIFKIKHTLNYFIFKFGSKKKIISTRLKSVMI